MIDLPAGHVQEYVTAAGIAAIYIASSPSGACRIGISRDLKRTMTMLRREGHDLTCVAAFWTDDSKTATRIAVSKTMRHGSGSALTQAEATARIMAAATDMQVHLTSHADVMRRVESAVLHIRSQLEQARKDGGLAWFNRAYHEWRIRAKTCGHPPLSYNQARARLQRIIVKRHYWINAPQLDERMGIAGVRLLT